MATTSKADGGYDKHDDESRCVAIRFCQYCGNILFPRPDREKRILLYCCRTCGFSEIYDQSNCVYVNKIEHHMNELRNIVPDIISDTTLPRTDEHPCPKCHHKEAVFCQANTKKAQEAMRLYYVCTNKRCMHRWTE